MEVLEDYLKIIVWIGIENVRLRLQPWFPEEGTNVASIDALRDMSWSTCEINPGIMWRQSRWRHEPGNYKACPNEAVTSLKSEKVAYGHEGDVARDATFVPSSGNRGYSRNRTFPFKGTQLRQLALWGTLIKHHHSNEFLSCVKSNEQH